MNEVEITLDEFLHEVRQARRDRSGVGRLTGVSIQISKPELADAVQAGAACREPPRESVSIGVDMPEKGRVWFRISAEKLRIERME